MTRDLVATTRPPAKLNLFLELLGKRPDGFHEIDTVMVPIDLCDEMRIVRNDSGIALNVGWLPSKRIVANRLGVDVECEDASTLLEIPDDERNLVWRALDQFRRQFDLDVGFDCTLQKRIPIGAGMGGASSNAASALLCAAKLCDVAMDDPKVFKIAADLGSDIPFFLGCDGQLGAARGQGRGEKISPVHLGARLTFVIVYPGVCLSTSEVYSKCEIPETPVSAEAIVGALSTGLLAEIFPWLLNRLSDPAKKILPRIDEILESMWQSGLQACQLTGSGSTCFGVSTSESLARSAATRLRNKFCPGAFVTITHSTNVPARIQLSS